MLLRLFSILLVFFVTACVNDAPRKHSLSFRQFAPFYMAVSSIEFIDEYSPPSRAPYIEHLMPFSPSDAMRIWIRDRMVAAGGNKTLRIIVRDASVTRTDVSAPLDALNVFSSSPDEQYDAKLVVEIRAYGESALSEANFNISASRSVTVPTSASAADRRDYQFRVVQELMTIANAELEKNLYQYMSNYISYSQNP